MKKRIVVLVLIVAALGLSGLTFHAYNVLSFKVRSRSSDQRVEVYGLPFKGVSSHPLDGCLRVYTFALAEGFDGGTWQTTIPWGTDIRVQWDASGRGSFSLCKGGALKMTWNVSGTEATCVFGSDLITYDPHDLWARTGRPTP
jgi:hypothetical protein